MKPKMQPKQLVKFKDVFYISAKKKQNTEELKTRLRELLDLYADLESEAEERVEKAVSEIKEKNTERFHKYLV